MSRRHPLDVGAERAQLGFHAVVAAVEVIDAVDDRRSLADGAATITETIFENRFMHVNELLRLGAKVDVDGRVAVVQGVDKLSGATVMATDLRASAGLVIAALVAEGVTVVDRIYHLDRGYDRMEANLRALGADVERVAA